MLYKSAVPNLSRLMDWQGDEREWFRESSWCAHLRVQLHLPERQARVPAARTNGALYIYYFFAIL